jgi:MSHA biogenesis protein MshP
MFRQKGLGLPSALFLIIVMILIVAAINQLNEVNASAYGREWLSMRAFYAAESGAQISAVRALNPSQALGACDNNFISNQVLSNPGLNGCRISVSCYSQSVEGDIYFTFTSTGTCGNGTDIANRVIQVRLLQ